VVTAEAGIEEFHAKAQRRKGAKSQRRAAMCENEVAKIIVDVAYHIHKQLGPGLLE